MKEKDTENSVRVLYAFWQKNPNVASNKKRVLFHIVSCECLFSSERCFPKKNWNMISKLLILLTERSICLKYWSSLSASIKTFGLMIKALIFKEPILTFKWHLSFLIFALLPLGGALCIQFKRHFRKHIYLFTSYKPDISDDHILWDNSYFCTLHCCGRLDIMKIESVYLKFFFHAFKT